MKSRSGFTLIELMIVVAIIAVLSSLALPSYQDRVIRAQVSEGIGLSEFVRQAVAAHYARHKRMPKDNAAAGLPESRFIVGNHVSEIAVVEGAVTITYGNRSNRHLVGKKLALRPAIVEDHPVVPIAWVCGSASVPERMKVLGANDTTLPVPHMPVDCR